MKKLSILILAITLGCGTQTQKCDQVDPKQAEQLVIDFLIAANESDFEKMQRLTTQDYTVYLDGEVYNHDKLVQLIIDFPAPAECLFEEFEFDVDSDCNSALLKYYYVETLTKNDTKVKSYDLQSAHIIRIGDELKLNFIHSTTVNNSAANNTP
ncbi:hypothetical protein [Lentiprolixibacter aurantiacus]|uniref:Uncharacterized protein n=1 Tax=Lentiprolixibacter aurantiacus TaxID=2993939 RepID=A0AAE3MJL8_9FLAO|nr:hypothetical protein [Lentiprolixibacter aurantiacus]MCX2718639.1 hypothetical protein [Lentiprolixibacter aurantiacus]